MFAQNWHENFGVQLGKMIKYLYICHDSDMNGTRCKIIKKAAQIIMVLVLQLSSGTFGNMCAHAKYKF